MNNKLTVKEALEQGYTHFGYSDEGYQPMIDLIDFDTAKASGKERLFSKEYMHPTIDVENIKHLIGNDIEDNWAAETHDDDSTAIIREVNEMDDLPFQAVADVVNDELKKYHQYYRLSDIKLVP